MDALRRCEDIPRRPLTFIVFAFACAEDMDVLLTKRVVDLTHQCQVAYLRTGYYPLASSTTQASSSLSLS